MSTVDPTRDFKKIEIFFEDISKVLTDFACSYGMVIQKYRHDDPEWCFLFSHPAGGQANMQVLWTGGTKGYICCNWRDDDYETETRTGYDLKLINQFDLKEDILKRLLEKMFMDLLVSKKTVSWVNKLDWKKTISKEVFEEGMIRFPKILVPIAWLPPEL